MNRKTEPVTNVKNKTNIHDAVHAKRSMYEQVSTHIVISTKHANTLTDDNQRSNGIARGYSKSTNLDNTRMNPQTKDVSGEGGKRNVSLTSSQSPPAQESALSAVCQTPSENQSVWLSRFHSLLLLE